LKKKFKEIILSLIKLNNTPPEIALGISIGVLISVMPLYGLHTALVILAAILVRPANKIAILLGTNFSLPPTIPFITWAGYEIGRFILRKNYPSLSWVYFKTMNLAKFKEFYVPLFVGSVVLGLILAGISYFITLAIVKTMRKRKAQMEIKSENKD